MWWSRTRTRGFLVALLALGALSGCGFSSLYGKQDSGHATGELQQIKIKPIEDRIGQIVHNHLIDMLNPGGRPARSAYELFVTLNESTAKLAIERNAFATRADLSLQARFRLVDRASGKELYASNDLVIGSYNLYDSDYATLAAAKDARQRAAREISQIIHSKLAAYFSQRRGRS